MKDILDFEYYEFKDGFGKPENPHEVVRGSDNWKQFNAFAEEEKLPAPNIPNGRYKKHLVDIISKTYTRFAGYDRFGELITGSEVESSNGIPFPYKKMYRLVSSR